MTEPRALEPAPGVRVEWPRAGKGEAPSWRLTAPIPDDYAALRVLTATLDDGATLVLAAARPAGADGHDEESVVAELAAEDGVERFEEALISVEYAGDGTARRVGLELYRAGEAFPLRAAGDASGHESGELHGLRRDSTTLRFRLDGRPGSATLDIVHL